MAYQEGAGTVFTAQDLVKVMKIFLDSNGWTIERYDETYHTDQVALSVRKPGGSNMYFDIIGTNDDMWVSMHETQDTGLDFGTVQPDSQSYSTQTTNMQGPFVKYYFFEGDEFLHVVVEREANKFRHFGFGVVEKAGDYTGGEYAYGTKLYTSLQYDQESQRHSYAFDSYYNGYSYGHGQSYIRFVEGGLHWCDFGYQTSTYDSRYGKAVGNFRSGGPMRDLQSRSPSVFTGIMPLFPLTVFARRTNDTWNILGCVKNFRQTHMDNRQPGMYYSIGSDTWVIFPWVGYGTSGEDSGSYAFAFKKEV